MARFLFLSIFLASSLAFGGWRTPSPVFSAKRACQAIVNRDAGSCDGNKDCEAVIYQDIDECRNPDCEAIIKSSESRCITDDCRAVVNRTTLTCGSDNCRAVILGKPGLCQDTW